MQKKKRYHILGNTWWILKIAWQANKLAVLLCIIRAILEIMYHMTELYLSPEILGVIERQGTLKELLGVIFLFVLVLMVTRALKSYLEQYHSYPTMDVCSKVTELLVKKSATTSYSNLLDADYLHLQNKAYDNASRSDSGVGIFWWNLVYLLRDLGGFSLYLLILSGIDPRLMLLVVFTCLVEFIVSNKTQKWIHQHQEEEQIYITRKAYIKKVSESQVLAKDIRIFGLQNWLESLFDRAYDLYLGYRGKIEKRLLISELVSVILTTARNGIAYIYLIRQMLEEGYSVSEFLLYFTAVTTFTTWIVGILEEASDLYKNIIELHQIREFLEWKEPFPLEVGDEIPEKEGYEIRLENVSFRYPNAKKDTIHQMNVVIKPGEKIAVVGLNGAGKTTLVKLICGFLNPTEGRILLNGRDIKEYKRNAYYELFSAVFQDFSVLDVTVAENIAQSVVEIEEERLKDSIEKAGISEMIKEFPKGLDTHVGRTVFEDGRLFSGGQIQKLMLARALYKNGKILILDEPTAALDPIAENEIYQKYHEMTQGKSSVFISHRLASTRFCDRILYMEQGQIVEEGSHEELMRLGLKYAELFEVQSSYYKEGVDENGLEF